MASIKEDKDRENRIAMEIVADAYDKTERAMGWYCYLEEKLNFPFKAKCIAKRSISPLTKGEIVKVVEMAPEDECKQEMFVSIIWGKRTLAVPLSQIEGVKVNDEIQQVIEDWHYWVKRGYEF